MAKGRIAQASDAEYIKAWAEFRENFKKATPVNVNESHGDKIKRIARLESRPEEWFAYYYPNYCTAKPAKFHRSATRRLVKNAEWYEVRAWSRELAKSARSMMEITYLAMTGKTKNVILVSNSSDNAQRLLLPFKSCFEANQRLIFDYGEQETFGNWSKDEFLIRKGCAFRAIGWGQSPRGSRNENIRPDFILIDDIDTDEECRNEDTMTAKINWIEQALFATRSISCDTRILVNGNIIHDNCAVNSLGQKADKFEVINIRDKDGKSSWPEKNTEEQIDRVLKNVSYESQQKEYYNNPMDGSDTFKDLKDGKLPSLKSLNVCIYADPSTSNKDVSSGSFKAVGVLVQKGFDCYIAKVWLDTIGNSRFVDALFEAQAWAKAKGAENVRIWIENNSLQSPFLEQVIMPEIFRRSKETNILLPIMGDDRKKPDKYTRIEGTLEPLNRNGQMIFNENEAQCPHMMRLKAQFRNFSRKQKRMDGPDMVEGGIFKLQEKFAMQATGGIEHVPRVNNKRM